MELWFDVQSEGLWKFIPLCQSWRAAAAACIMCNLMQTSILCSFICFFTFIRAGRRLFFLFSTNDRALLPWLPGHDRRTVICGSVLHLKNQTVAYVVHCLSVCIVSMCSPSVIMNHFLCWCCLFALGHTEGHTLSRTKLNWTEPLPDSTMLLLQPSAKPNWRSPHTDPIEIIPRSAAF